MNKTKIDWCTHTLNPVIGCTFGCEYCYAKKMNDRFKWIDDFSKPQFFPERLKMLDSKTPKIIFMDSMSDIADWKVVWIDHVFKAIERNPQHIYLFLTKRQEETYRKISQEKDKPQNLYIGTSICTNENMQLNALCNSGEPDFYSIEPILQEIEPLFAKYTKWVIIGAETGNRKGKVIPKREWIEEIAFECKRNNIPIFMKSSLKDIWNREVYGDELIQEYPWEVIK